MRRIEVDSYSGHKGEEKPLSFILEGKRLRVTEILENRLVEDSLTRERRRVFRVKAEDGNVYSLVYVEVQEEWILNDARR